MKQFLGFVGGFFMMAFACVTLQSIGFGATNTWVPQTSGDWHVTNNWSFGILPDSSQSVRIDAPGWKAVAINPITSANYPGSLTVQNLTIRNNSTQDVNTLLLNYAGTVTPLRILNGLAVQDAARIVNFNSALVVDGGGFVVTNAEVIQDGGLVRATNGGLALRGAAYYLTNGLFEADVMSLNGISAFNQYGGSATIREMYFCYGPAGGGTYSLYGGQLTVQTLNMNFDNNSVSSFVQTGGTNNAQYLSIQSGLYGNSGQYTLSGGFLQTSNTVLMSGPAHATFQQNGGIHRSTQTLTLEGALWHGNSPRPADYILAGGQLFATTLQVRSFGSFTQSNGLASISGAFQLVGNDTFGKWTSTLAGGTLACSNFLSSGSGANFRKQEAP
jgi:hypothetical protein